MNGISSVVAALTSKKRVLRTLREGSKTEALRELLRKRPSTSAELSMWTGFPRSDVSALLAVCVNKGQILLHNGHYRMNPNYEETRIRNAIALLREHGYTVEKR